MLRLYSSNRLEALAAAFIARVRLSPASAALQPIPVVVPSMGTGQWLRQQMAEALGIAAQLDFQLPSAFAWQVCCAFDPALQSESDYTLERLRWRLYHQLPDLREPVFAPLRDYLYEPQAERGGSSDRAVRKRFQLATQLAVLFDQYLVYRRDWIAAFEGGHFRFADDAQLFENESWQPALWRRLIADIGTANHRAHAFTEVLGLLLAPNLELPPLLPSRITVFGVPALPQDLVLLFGALATRIDVDVFVPNACRAYWADIVSPRALAVLQLRAAQRLRVDEIDQQRAAHYLEVGQPLLANCGRMNRDGVDLLNELVETLGEQAEHADCFLLPEGDSMLVRLQQDILELRAPDSSDIEAGGRAVTADDESIQIHLCHSALREVEVLHDRLLAGFAADAALEPRDVLVMVPDLETYAPLVEAVFASAPPARRIRIEIADRQGDAAAPVLAALRQLLHLDSSRWAASEILALLDIPALQTRFDLEGDRLAQVRYWLRAAGVRWGRDAQDWQRRDLPTNESTHLEQPNTWAFALERLLIGYAMPDASGVFDGVAPMPGVDGQSARALDGVLRLVELLDSIAEELQTPVAAVAWQQRIERWLAALFAPARDDAQTFLALGGLRDALRRLVADQPAAHASAELSATVVREYLEAAWSGTAESPRYLTGAVTLCTLLPMRSLPFAHVHLLGMNERDYPRQSVAPAFDLMAHGSRRKGDRVRRDEDRQLFLDALLSARTRLHLSYVGQSDRSGEPRNPSVLVTELLDVVQQRFVMNDRSSLHAHLVRQHPLQPFSAKYDGRKLVTYEDLWQTSSAAHPQRLAPELEQRAAPRSDTQAEIVVSPAELQQFVRNPSRWFLRNVLDARAPANAAGLDDDEPMDLGGLERYGLASAALDAIRAQRFEEWAERARGTGELPHGVAGEEWLRRWHTELSALLERGDAWARAKTGAVHIDLHLPDAEHGQVRIVGPLERISDFGYLQLRVGTPSARDLADAYVAQLLLCASGMQTNSHVFAVAEQHSRQAVDAARALRCLADNAVLRAQAMHTAVPLFIGTAQAHVKRPDAVRVPSTWGEDKEPDEFARQERFDADVQLLWGDCSSPPMGWQLCAERVYAHFVEMTARKSTRGAHKADDGA